MQLTELQLPKYTVNELDVILAHSNNLELECKWTKDNRDKILYEQHLLYKIKL